MASTVNDVPRRRPRACGALSTVLLLGLVACDQADPAGAGGRGGGGNGASGGLGGAAGDGAGGGVAGSAGKGGAVGAGGAAGNAGSSGGRGGAGTGGMAGKGGGSGSGGTGAGGAHVGGCTLTESYTIVDAGSLGSYQRQTVLSPPDQFRYERQDPAVQDTRPSCMPALPACLTASKIDVSDIEGALANVDVGAAFAATPSPLFGMIGVADGPTFTVQRSSGGAFTIGIECAAVSATCLPTPAGVRALVKVLRDLIAQQTVDPSCAAAAI